MQDWRFKTKGDNVFKMQDAVIQFLREMVEYLSMHLVSIVFTIIKGGLSAPVMRPLLLFRKLATGGDFLKLSVIFRISTFFIAPR